MLTKYVACEDQHGAAHIVKVQFRPYLENDGWDASYLEGHLMLHGYFRAFIFENDTIL